MQNNKDDLFHYQDMSLEELYRQQRPEMDRFIFMERYKPLLTTAALLFTGVFLGAVLWIGYPDANSSGEGRVPVIHADASDYKVSPEEPGGMDVPHRDSVIFDTIQTAGDLQDLSPAGGVENLLDEPVVEEEMPIDKNAYFSSIDDAKKNANKYRATGSPALDSSLVESLSVEDYDSQNAETAENITNITDYPLTVAKENSAADVMMKQRKSPSLDIEQKDMVSDSSGIAKEPARIQVVDVPVPTIKPKKPLAFKMKGVKEHRQITANTSSGDVETMDFVRSVLQQKDTSRESASVASIQPSAGYQAAQEIPRTSLTPAPVVSAGISAGTHYIQLGSLNSQGRAEAHWENLQRQFSSELGGLSMRVQKADLGDRGMFYRVQAGPLPADQAYSLCDSIKAQKPGGCLVVGQ